MSSSGRSAGTRLPSTSGTRLPHQTSSCTARGKKLFRKSLRSPSMRTWRRGLPMTKTTSCCSERSEKKKARTASEFHHRLTSLRVIMRTIDDVLNRLRADGAGTRLRAEFLEMPGLRLKPCLLYTSDAADDLLCV